MKRRSVLKNLAASTLGGSHALGLLSGCRTLVGPDDDDPWGSGDPFLSGNNAPVFEEVDAVPLSIDGEVPAELDGVFLRNGPNPRYQPLEYNFPFDGDGMIHGVFFDRGQVSYRNRWVRTAGFLEEHASGRAVFGSILGSGRTKNPANTSVVSHAGRTLALWEGGLPYRIDSDLNTVGVFNFAGGLRGKMAAHPKVDPMTGQLHSFKYHLGSEPFLHYFVADPSGELVRAQPIETGRPTIVHDMAITPSYAVFFLAPVFFDRGRNDFRWHDGEPTLVVLVNRRDEHAAPMVLETEALFLWHFVNAYEAGTTLIVDYVRHGRPSFARGSAPFAAPMLWRASIDVPQMTVRHERRNSVVTEYPTIAAADVGRVASFSYGAAITSFHRLPEYFDTLAQFELEGGNVVRRNLGPGRFTGEPLVVPGNDGNYVLTFVFDQRDNRSDLLILRESDFGGNPVATIRLPVRIPNGLHGHWVPSGSG